MVEGGQSRQVLRARERPETAGSGLLASAIEGTVMPLVAAGARRPRPTSARDRKAREIVVYLDENPLARACFADWLSASLRAFAVVPVGRLEDLPRPDVDRRRVRLVLVNLWNRPLAPADIEELLEAVSLHCSEARIAVLSDSGDAAEIGQAIAAGVHGFIPVTLPPAVAAQAILLVMCGGVFAPAEILADSRWLPSTDPARRRFHPALTPRQSEIVQCIRRGMANKEIGYTLRLSESAVKGHVRTIMRKLGAQNRTQVAYLTGELTAG